MGRWGTLPPFWQLPQTPNSPPRCSSVIGPPRPNPSLGLSLALQDEDCTVSHSPSGFLSSWWGDSS